MKKGPKAASVGLSVRLRCSSLLVVIESMAAAGCTVPFLLTMESDNERVKP